MGVSDSGDDLDLGLRTATWMAAAIRRREVSSRELVEHHLRRIERLNPSVNAVVTLDAEGALAEAAAADEALARGDDVGPLHGLPVTVKDSLETAGLRTTAGAPELAGHVPDRDAPAVARLRAAGAIVMGKTNLPAWASDCQCFNDLFGTTSNPWDPARTPGGSSGGSAAAIASGLAALELGSDVGGSIRIPAGFCGVYGLKPSFGIVPTRGHIPPAPGTTLTLDVAAVGPLARSADDLELALDVVAGPDDLDAPAWRLSLPPPRHDSLEGYRIAVWLDDPSCPTAPATGDRLGAAVEALAAAGARVRPASGQPDLAHGVSVAQRLLQGMFSIAIPDADFEQMLKEAGALVDRDQSPHARWLRNTTQRARELQGVVQERAALRAAWADFFTEHDVLLCPAMPWPAFEHDRNPDVDARVMRVDGVDHSYSDGFAWLQAVGVAYLPSVVAPVGLTPSGVPVGMQIVAPFLEDRTAIDVARRLAAVVGGFVPPPGVA